MQYEPQSIFIYFESMKWCHALGSKEISTKLMSTIEVGGYFYIERTWPHNDSNNRQTCPCKNINSTKEASYIVSLELVKVKKFQTVSKLVFNKDG